MSVDIITGVGIVSVCLLGLIAFRLQYLAGEYRRRWLQERERRRFAEGRYSIY